MRVPVALPLVLLLVAGCVAEEPAPADADGTPVEPAAGAARAGDERPRPMEGDVGHMPHMHDYWQGRERVTLFDDEVAPSEDPFLLFAGFPNGVGATVWRLPDGAIVMEGTGALELTATYDDPLTTPVSVSYRIGGSGEWSAPVALPDAERVDIAVTPEMTDLPHQSVSRWEFLFSPAEAPGAFLGPFHLRAEIVRIADIMLFPGHPELFEGKPEKVIMDATHEHAEQSYAARAPQLVTEGGFQEKFVAPDELVPMETKAMRIELHILHASASPGQVADIRFFYHGADTSYIGHPYVLPLEGSLAEKHLVYQIPVAPEQTDSPYGEESQWLFFVEPTTKFVGAEEEPDCGGCTDVSIEYHLKVIAYDHELEAYSKMEGED